jgi:hypothetical protein
MQLPQPQQPKHRHQTSRGFGAGILIGFAIVAPVFAATRVDPFTTYEVLLLVLAAILFVSLALEAIVERDIHERDANTEFSDAWTGASQTDAWRVNTGLDGPKLSR